MKPSPTAAEAEPEPEPALQYEPSELPETLGDLVEAIKKATADGKPAVMLDLPAKFQRWQLEQWANPGSVMLTEGVSGQPPAVVLQREPGAREKWAITMAQQMDLSSYDSASVDVKAEKPFSVAVAVWVGNVIFESKPQPAAPGRWQSISVPLKGRDFKAAATNWEFGTEIADPAAATRISLLFYGESSDPVQVRRLRVSISE
jgi:hypothetical protein